MGRKAMLGIFAGIVCAWIVVGLVPYWRVAPAGQDTRLARAGQAGDSFGAATSLFSALGFAGVVCALVYQARERRESAETNRKAATISLATAMIHARAAILKAHTDRAGVTMEIARHDSPAVGGTRDEWFKAMTDEMMRSDAEIDKLGNLMRFVEAEFKELQR